MSLLLDFQLQAARAAIENKTILRAFANVQADLGELAKLGELRGAPKFDRRADSRTLRARMTSDRLDSHGTIIDPTGVDAERFLRNPILLWQHGMDAAGYMPIGQVYDLEFGRNAIDGTIRFDSGTPLAKTIAGLYARKILRAWSIGFVPRTLEVTEVKDASGTREVPKYTNWELLELSAVAVPSNPDCVVLEDEAA